MSPHSESQRFHDWVGKQPSSKDRLRTFWSQWFRSENPHMAEKWTGHIPPTSTDPHKATTLHGHVEMLGDLPDTAPVNPRNTPPPRSACSKDPWPDARGTTTRPNAPCCKTVEFEGDPRECSFSDKDLSILTEAHGLVHGDRQASYGHPAVDFARTAALVNVLLASKLSSDLGPEDVALFMVAVKLSRECHEPARDNLVDAAGYLECRARVLRFLGTAPASAKDAL